MMELGEALSNARSWLNHYETFKTLVDVLEVAGRAETITQKATRAAEAAEDRRLAADAARLVLERQIEALVGARERAERNLNEWKASLDEKQRRAEDAHDQALRVAKETTARQRAGLQADLRKEESHLEAVHQQVGAAQERLNGLLAEIAALKARL